MSHLEENLKPSKERTHCRNLQEVQDLQRRSYSTLSIFHKRWITCWIQIKITKVFTYEGESTDTLFGQHLFPTTGKRIVVTEGELDAASCYEAMPNWPMVSLPHGAASAKKDLQKQLPLFQGYEEIVLFFDGDEPGRKAAEEAAGVLPAGKVKIARMESY